MGRGNSWHFVQPPILGCFGVYFGGWGGAEIGGISGGWFCQGFRGIWGVSGNRGILGGGGI